MQKSLDGGLTWSGRLAVPASSTDSAITAPTIHRMIDPRPGMNNKERLLITVTDRTPWQMIMSVSEDLGLTWTEYTRQFPHIPAGIPGASGGSPPKEAMLLPDGRYMLGWYAPLSGGGSGPTGLYVSFTEDAGLTWSDPHRTDRFNPYTASIVANESFSLMSPDQKRMVRIARVGQGPPNTVIYASDDFGENWWPFVEGNAAITGDRHIGRYLPDGRLILTFRDNNRATATSTHGDFVAWVGTYDDLVNQRGGQYRIRLLDNLAGPGETGYSGLEVLPDGTIISSTYCDLRDNGIKDPEIVAVRFRIEDIDALSPGVTQLSSLPEITNSDQLMVNWISPSPGTAENYILQRSATAEFNTVLEELVIDGTSTNSTFTSLALNTKFYFRVASQNNNGKDGATIQGAWSNIESTTLALSEPANASHWILY